MKRFWILLSVGAVITLVVCGRRTSIEVISNPEGADVYLDDTLTEEKTNCMLKDVESGEHTIAVRLEGYSIWEETFTLEEGETYTVGAIFEEVGSLKWKYQIGDTISSGLAIGADGTVYFGSFDGNLYALNPDGTLKWKYQTGGWVRGFPAIGLDETIYFTSDDGFLYALSEPGVLKWSYNVGEVVYTSPTIGKDGTIYIPSETGLCALDHNGNLMWLHSNVLITPSIGSDGTIYCDYSEPDELYYEVLALNPDGSEKWRCSIWDNWLWPSPAIGSEGKIYFGALPNEFLIAVNPDGSIDWISDDTLFACPWFGSPTIGIDGTLYLNSMHGLCAVTPTGTVKWFYETSEGRLVFSPTLGFDGTIYLSDQDGVIYALNTNGEERWKFQASGEIWYPPVIASDGTIYFGSTDGYLYAIYSDSRGLANSPWPKFQHDNQNTGRAGTP